MSQGRLGIDDVIDKQTDDLERDLRGETAVVESSVEVKRKDDKDYRLVDQELRVLGVKKTNGAKVETGMATTINMGDYESIRVDARVHLPCNVGDVAVAFDAAWKIAREEVSRKALEVKNHRDAFMNGKIRREAEKTIRG